MGTEGEREWGQRVSESGERGGVRVGTEGE